ncbi:hypothetical protein CDLVIII_0106 [Clostridium sp. DL-VIII]|nr:hypothetical protein CDLVIII_0106 [Clostridium sp. DL-VIII]
MNIEFEELFKKDFISFFISLDCKNVVKNNLIVLGMEI